MITDGVAGSLCSRKCVFLFCFLFDFAAFRFANCPTRQETRTLLVTDMVVKVDGEVPDIVAEDPRPLLFHARDNALEKVEDTREVRLKGWRRIVQV